ncbi:hypothetical protein B0H15DRAFT_836925 [Mycena belliarum]|uniref:Uncharacterized protein n=1 Tax=Mycena belliarum TaxID=1033014 RepID=A0AAD6U7E5_9AGAR|nr:hypothetical protein B0H15DRAFT_836925 [Mycena belliae]
MNESADATDARDTSDVGRAASPFGETARPRDVWGVSRRECGGAHASPKTWGNAEEEGRPLMPRPLPAPARARSSVGSVGPRVNADAPPDEENADEESAEKAEAYESVLSALDVGERVLVVGLGLWLVVGCGKVLGKAEDDEEERAGRPEFEARSGKSPEVEEEGRWPRPDVDGGEGRPEVEERFDGERALGGGEGGGRPAEEVGDEPGVEACGGLGAPAPEGRRACDGLGGAACCKLDIAAPLPKFDAASAVWEPEAHGAGASTWERARRMRELLCARKAALSPFSWIFIALGLRVAGGLSTGTGGGARVGRGGGRATDAALNYFVTAQSLDDEGTHALRPQPGLGPRCPCRRCRPRRRRVRSRLCARGRAWAGTRPST